MFVKVLPIHLYPKNKNLLQLNLFSRMNSAQNKEWPWSGDQHNRVHLLKK